MDALCPIHGDPLPCFHCTNIKPYQGPLQQTLVVHGPDGDVEFSVKNGLVSRCVQAIANQNITDAKWAVEVLNKFGHFVHF